MTWKPRRTLQETEVLLRAPGCVHEVETTLVDGRLYRVYKNLWPSLRDFWLSAVSQYSTDIYIVYEDLRLTYAQVHNRIIQVAASFHQLYGLKKGDRVGICSRNCPDYLVAFWACHLIGAVSVLVNAWLPPQPLHHCLVHTECKLIILDPERASSLETTVSNISEAVGGTKFLVMDTTDKTRRWQGMEFFNDAVDLFPMAFVKGAHTKAPTQGMDPEDNATIIFTSGTTGLPKGVLSTQRQFLTNVLNVLAGGCRAALRRGETLSVTQRGGLQKAILISVPLFHVTGSTSFSMIATMTGMKIVLMRKWEVEEAAKLIKRENVVVAGGVPAMISDLSDSSLVGHPLEGLLFGGAPAPDSLIPRARKAFPTATMIQGYGLTETNSIAVSFAGEDYIARPSSTGLASPVNDIMIMWNGVALPHHSVGEVWLRGPNVMKGYWRDPEATNKVITTDGWLKTGDLGYLDEENFLFIKDRLKDVIIRGGENVDSVSVENALYSDDRILEAAVVGVPDERLGELVAAVVSIKPAFRGQVTEAELILQAQKSLPKFAVPVMVVIVDHALERTPSGKIVKGITRKLARRHWEDRCRIGILWMCYEAEFRKHLAQVQCHLSGDYGKQLPPSFVHPSTYWSSTEKNAFFHALSIHSRLRPDLIAASLGTKSVLDVCIYLDILHVAATDANSPIARRSLPCAMEVSESWIKWEEAAAARIQPECQWDEEGETNTGENEINSSQQKQALRMLDACHLAVMESMLREAETKGIGLEQDVGMTSNTDYHRDAVCQSPPVTSSPHNNKSDFSHILQPRSPTPRFQQEDDPNLTPTSRRRLQKRIYMRRKRAEALGEAFDPESARLRPGRKLREHKPAKLRPKTYKTTKKLKKGLISNVVDHVSGSLNTRQPNKGGLGRPYKIKQQFMEYKIDAQTLNEHDLGFLHLSTLARFMKLFRSGYDFPKAGAVVAISDDTIRLLTSVAVEFTTQLVHLSITSREQEKSVKGNLKVWRQNHEEVTPEHVRQGLTVMGATFLSKESYFKTLLGSEAFLNAEEREPSPTGEGSNKSIDHNNEDGIPICPRALASTNHNRTHLEQVTLPLSLSIVDSFQDEDLKCFNTLMPPEMEDGDLQLELDAEMEIDDFDMHRSKEYEDRLWVPNH